MQSSAACTTQTCGPLKKLISLCIIAVLIVHIWAFLFGFNAYPFTDYHIFAEAVTIESLSVYLSAATDHSGKIHYLREDPVVYEHQNAFSSWVHDFVIEQEAFFHPRHGRWIPRGTHANTLKELDIFSAFDFRLNEVLLVRFTAVPSDNYWQTINFEGEVVVTLVK